ncbi:hypothetical protein CR970_00710 [Candidatus Saccharibacteria bacterium]|nr:MAG: hypothetical protein CR970_00710 [Candidatus Saccharibacteria bacterium]
MRDDIYGEQDPYGFLAALQGASLAEQEVPELQQQFDEELRQSFEVERLGQLAAQTVELSEAFEYMAPVRDDESQDGTSWWKGILQPTFAGFAEELHERVRSEGVAVPGRFGSPGCHIVDLTTTQNYCQRGSFVHGELQVELTDPDGSVQASHRLPTHSITSQHGDPARHYLSAIDVSSGTTETATLGEVLDVYRSRYAAPNGKLGGLVERRLIDREVRTTLREATAVAERWTIQQQKAHDIVSHVVQSALDDTDLSPMILRPGVANGLNVWRSYEA